MPVSGMKKVKILFVIFVFRFWGVGVAFQIATIGTIAASDASIVDVTRHLPLSSFLGGLLAPHELSTLSTTCTHFRGQIRADPRLRQIVQDEASMMNPTLAAGEGRTCIVGKAGRGRNVYCWGGNGHDDQADVPDGLGIVRSIAVKRTYICVVQLDGSVRCRGNSSYRSLYGDNAPNIVLNSFGPVNLLAAGEDHTCVVLRADGSVRCWDWNSNGLASVDEAGELGPGPARLIAAGVSFTCVVLKADDSVRCWGGSNQYGQTTVPETYRLGGRVRSITAGGFHACVLDMKGKVTCWGWNKYGQTDVPEDLPPVRLIVAGMSHTCAVLVGGGVRCWGNKTNGQTNVPEVFNSSGVEVYSMAAGSDYTCATDIRGKVYCWGWNHRGQTEVPIDLPPVVTATVSVPVVSACPVPGGLGRPTPTTDCDIL
ncbi:MAG: hypothetical protein HQK53_12540 [Oligoflexia bacterium]|nr:hypothetical protein [Oligoflexia bacterium]